MAPRKPKPLKLGEENWGQKVRRGYYLSKSIYGQTWEELAQRISQVQSITETSLMRLMTVEEKPTRAKALQMAWLLALALGIDPAEFDLYPEDLNSNFLTSKEVADLLRPSSPCFTISAA